VSKSSPDNPIAVEVATLCFCTVTTEPANALFIFFIPKQSFGTGVMSPGRTNIS
jgi:hypothetical protein